ncbi:MAG: glycine cleavage system protein GcvH [Anaerohalosphaeraceae bacterium]|nr:glycine cleavage system protein GcvH [Anaerohalosphaeraceae bacterium]
MVPQDLFYTEDHEWAKIQGDTATLGISDYAQESLGEITFVELPAPNKSVQPHDELAVIESSKAASDIYSPFAGVVTEVNDQLESQPELMNSDCYNDGWVCKLKLSAPSKTDELMNAAQYSEYLETL